MRIAIRVLTGTVLCGIGTAAVAHTGHGTASWFSGLTHPLGLDHLLAMVSVGLWSAAALPARRRLAGPALFMAALLCGAAAGVAGLGSPWLESAIAASVALLGAMLVAPRALPVPGAALAIAAAGLLHGLAHGAELPAGAAFGGYAAGFLAATALLHGAGLKLGRAMQAMPTWLWRAMAAGLGLSGALLLVRV
jgi:urease accessory protein